MGETMRVGITGASGLIGGALTQTLRQRGDVVIPFVRPNSPTTDGLQIRWNPMKDDADERDIAEVGGLDAVVNLAGTGIADKRWSESRKKEILESRVKSTALLARILPTLSSPPAILASGSAIGFYGSKGDQVLDENSPVGTDFLADVCQQWEQATQALSGTSTGVAFLRTGIVQSERGGSLKKQLPLFRFGVGGSLGSGKQWLSPISLNDEIRAILFIIEHAHTGPFNLVCPHPLQNKTFTKELAKILRRPAILPVPSLALSLVLGGELVKEAVLASQRVMPSRLLELGFAFGESTNEEILTSILKK
jgi:hypothetical protein